MSLSMIWRRVNVPASSLTCLGPNAGVGKSPALALADHPDGLSSSPAVSVEHQISYIHFCGIESGVISIGGGLLRGDLNSSHRHLQVSCCRSFT